MLDAFHAQATKAFEDAGVVDVDHFVKWAQENKGQAFTEAMHKHGTIRNTQAYRPLATEYVQNLDRINPEAVLNAELGPNVSMRRAQDGQIILKTPDGEMPWSTAIRTGLIKLSKRSGS